VVAVTERLIVTIHLPLEMLTVARLLKVIVKDYPDAVVAEPSVDGRMEIRADDDLTHAERRAKARAK
jgi:hypothetical protein